MYSRLYKTAHPAAYPDTSSGSAGTLDQPPLVVSVSNHSCGAALVEEVEGVETIERPYKIIGLPRNLLD